MSKAKKTTPTPAANGEAITDISHEVVDTKGSRTEKAVILNTDDQIKMEVAKFDLAEAGIANLKSKYEGLTITGPEDKEGYKAVREAWREVQSKRTGLSKKGLELRNSYGVITKAIKKYEDNLIDLLTPLEDDLYKKWKDIDEEKLRLQREQEEAEQRQVMARVEEVMNTGMVLRDGFYCVGDAISMDLATLRSLSDEQYEKLKARVSAEAEKIKEAEAIAARKKKEEEEEQKRAQEDLKKQQEELRKEQDELKRQQEELAEHKREAEKLKRDMRIAKMSVVGLYYNERSGYFTFDNGFKELSWADDIIFGLTDKQFEIQLQNCVTSVQVAHGAKADHDAQVEKEREELENKKKFIAASMDRAGFSFSYTGQSFTWEDKNTAIEVKFSDLLPLTEVEISDLAQFHQANIEELKKKTIQKDKLEKEAAEKEAKLALGDKDRYTQDYALIADAATKMVPGEFKTKKYQQRALAFLEELAVILKKFE